MTSLIPVVTVVDSDAAVRAALVSLIRSAGWMARACASAREFLAYPRLLCPSCLVVDVELPDLDGLELQRRVADRAEMPIIFMTRQLDVPTMVRAMKAGAFEFMTKPFREDAMLGAIGSGIEHSCAALQRAAELQSLLERYYSLSCREREVMALVVQGTMNKVIAAQLGIAEVTVKAHRGKVMLKMRAGSLAALVTLAAQLAATTAATSAYTKVLPGSSNRFDHCALL